MRIVGKRSTWGCRSIKFPNLEVHSLCMSSLELKTGALMGLALRMGGYAAGSSREQKESLSQLGNRLGVGLQMFDDAGNFAMDCGSEMSPKKHEDLHLRRPSWLWAFIADQYNSDDFERWKQAVSALPDETALLEWCREKNFIDRIRLGARAHLESTLKQMESKFSCHGLILKEARQFIKDLETGLCLMRNNKKIHCRSDRQRFWRLGRSHSTTVRGHPNNNF